MKLTTIFLALAALVSCSPPIAAQSVPSLGELTTPATGDLLYVVDISDTTDGAGGTGKKMTILRLQTILQPLDSDLTAIAALTTTSAGRGLLDDADAAALRTSIGVVIGTDVQAYRAELGKIGLKGSDIASASSIDIGASTGELIDITGTTAITALGTATAGTRRVLRFAGALTFTYNATSLILPGSASITTAAGDTATMHSLGSGNWVCSHYTSRSALPVLTAGTQTVAGAKTFSGVTTLSGGLTLPFKATATGDAAGTGAFDAQAQHTTGTKVASGTNAFAAGGDNTASGASSAAIGNDNVASEQNAFAAGGGNTASGVNAFAIGELTVASGDNAFSSGSESVASGDGSFAVGLQNTAVGDYSQAIGVDAKGRLRGQVAQSGGKIAATGDAQATRAVVRVETVDATPTELLINATDRFLIPTNTTISATVRISGRKQSGGAGSAFYGERRVVVANTGGTTALQGSVGTIGTDIDTLTIGSVAIAADNANDALSIEVTGVAATNIAWVAVIDAIEITY